MAAQPIDTFYCKLQDVTPEVWRLVQVPQNRTVAQLAYIVMVLFEMQAGHLFDVQVWDDLEDLSYQDHYTVPLDLDDEDPMDARYFKLKDIFHSNIGKATLNYDFGDSWHVSIVLVDVTTDPQLNARALPRVLGGAGFGIIEDIGGPEALMAFDRDFAAGTVSKEQRDWLGLEKFDLASFDQAEMNQRVKKIPRAYKQVYESEKELSVAMTHYIERRH